MHLLCRSIFTGNSEVYHKCVIAYIFYGAILWTFEGVANVGDLEHMQLYAMINDIVS